MADTQSIWIQLNAGHLTVVGSDDDQLRVTGQTYAPDRTEYLVISDEEQISIVAAGTGLFRDKPIQLEAKVPNQVKLTVETESASVTVRKYTGDLKVASGWGGITVQDVDGMLVLRSNRGDVTVEDSSGTISVVGNYGALTLQNVTGDIGVSTIMGSITFSGLVQNGDAVRLETDHGPVAVHLSPSSALDLQVRSTSGDVTCLLPSLISSSRACDGVFGFDRGTLTVRTVSGAATLQLTP